MLMLMRRGGVYKVKSQHKRAELVKCRCKRLVNKQPNKGRPKESEKRKKTLLEQREDAAKKNKKVKKDGETSTRAKKKKPAKQTRCPFCLENHHVSDCLVLKATLAKTSTVDACATEPTEPAVTAKANLNFDLNL
jgi:hypothetical protein